MSNGSIEPHKSSFGMDANMAVLIAYLGGVVISFIPGLRYIAWAVPLVVFFMESQSNFIKFHAMQSFTLIIIGMLLGLILGWIVGGNTARVIINIIVTILAIIAVSNAWKYQEYKIPLIGNLAVKIAAIFGTKV